MQTFFERLFKHRGFVILLLLILLCSPSILYLALNISDKNLFTTIQSIYSLLVTLSLILFLPLIFNTNVKRTFLFYFPLILTVPFALFTLVTYEQVPTRWMILSVITSNWAEMAEYTKGLWFWKLLVVILPVIYLFLIKLLKPGRLGVNKLVRRFFLFIFAILLVNAYIFKAIQMGTTKVPLNIIAKTAFKETPVFTMRRVAKAFKVKGNMQSLQFNYIEVKTATKQKPKNIVFILGESLRYDRLSLNGYYRNTTPFLQKEENLYSFSNIVSPSYYTSQAMPLVLSNLAVNDTSTGALVSLITLFKSAGYHTHWISNQRYPDGQTRVILKQVENYIGKGTLSKKNDFDKTVLSHLDACMNEYDTLNNFIVIHLMGSHFPYYKRYPKNFSVFKPDLEINEHPIFLFQHKEKLLNCYDNSVLYNDYILSEILGRLKLSTGINMAIYLSDHGENLFDNNISIGRGGKKITKHLYKIPMLVWLNDSYIEANKSKVDSISFRLGRAFSSENLIYTLSDLASLEWIGNQPDKSIINDTYSFPERWVHTEEDIVNFDNTKCLN